MLHDFAKADQDWLDDLLRGISDGAPALAAGDAARFMNAVALRTAPPRSSTGTEKPAPETQKAGASKAAAAPPAPEDTRNPLQRLMDKFR